jgi:gliding motility-associated protein GldE
LEIGWQYRLLLLVFLFICSAFFSGSEIALFSLDRNKLKDEAFSISIRGRYLLQLLEHPRRLLVTILIGSTIVNVGASIAAVSLSLELARSTQLSVEVVLLLQVVLLTFLVVIFGELVPKVWASKNPLRVSKLAAIPLYWINVIIFPISETLTELIRLSVTKFKFDKAKSAILPDEIAELADLSHERGTLVEEEQGLINSIVSFRSVSVYEVMTPRVDMISVSVNTTFTELLEIITNSGHSRIPLYREDLDEIIGIIYAKDILPYLKNEPSASELSLARIARKPMFIPETKKISELMREFQDKKMHIAIVVDEYGGTAGLITLEDILEEIIGEIRDEYDKEENLVTKVDDSTYIVLGKLSIDQMNELLNIEVNPEDGEFETVGGLVLNMAGQIPKEGYSFSMENYKYTVKEVIGKRIKKIMIEKQSSE